MISFFKNDIKMKIISMTFAFLMWVYVMAEVDPIIIRDFSGVNVDIQNMVQIKDSGMTVSPESKLDVRLILRGRRSVMKDVEDETIKVYSSIKAPHVGKNIMDVQVKVPEGLTYTLIPDNSISVELEEYVVEKKKIDLIIEGNPRDSFKISEVNINPQYTFVDGPKSLVDKINSLNVTLAVSNKKGSFNAKSNVVALDDHGREIKGVGIKDENVYVGVGIQKSKEVPIELVLKGEPDEDYRIKSKLMNPDKILIMGNEEEIEKIESIKTIPLDIGNLANDKKVELDLQIPENIFSETKKIFLNLDMSKVVVENLYISKERISYIGNIQNLDISKNDIPDNIKVKVAYLEESNKKFTSEDVEIFINMKEPLENPAKFKIEYNTPDGLEILEIEPKNATLGLEM
ncbi:YbbR domain-containing protein [Peptoclostridium litorale DSM 5388]|uniref:YbbR family protein n=1 Tax=Peptoclostridium litorale DSM 5388 TaxID=1121324 RepID=A0A069RE37_PEPLI|nr:CdaR family protein [Peptoclostridium litorale]KDR94460.1 hypothetical protein CLIT_18c00180 [Peptoclostridium litorale DSM 5388]SIO36977.1 YbbR domain-containing protein [Peptoclostridium litorale DSM 5388]